MNSVVNTRICIFVNSYPPAIGGIETFTKILAEGLAQANFEVTVIVNSKTNISKTPNLSRKSKKLIVLTQLNLLSKYRAVKNSDLVIFSHFSLKALPTVLANRKQFVIVHHTSPSAHFSRNDLRERLKRLIYIRSINVFVSQNLKSLTGLEGFVIHNGTDFPINPNIRSEGRPKDFVYVGRLVPDKGVATAIKAFAQLLEHNSNLNFQIVGSGNMEEELSQLAHSLGIAGKVQFLGDLDKIEVIAILREHKFLVLPSEWQEPFGLVTIEALTQGCIPVVAKIGGILEACGHCCITFESGNIQDLFQVLSHSIYNYQNLHAQVFDKIDMVRLSSNVMVSKYINFLSQLNGSKA
jgi:glycosyltransferase involved in cell wall biosynthesis